MDAQLDKTSSGGLWFNRSLTLQVLSFFIETKRQKSYFQFEIIINVFS